LIKGTGNVDIPDFKRSNGYTKVINGSTALFVEELGCSLIVKVMLGVGGDILAPPMALTWHSLKNNSKKERILAPTNFPQHFNQGGDEAGWTGCKPNRMNNGWKLWSKVTLPKMNNAIPRVSGHLRANSVGRVT